MKAKDKKRRDVQRRKAQIRYDQYKIIFDHVFECYQEIKETNGTMSCAGFYKRLADNTAASGSQPVSRTGAAQSDFLADIELAIKHVLTPAEISSLPNCEDPVKYKLAKEFMRRRISPLNVYFRPRTK